MTHEIFIELFSYIKPVDLYTDFVNLNSRIDVILHDIQINISYMIIFVFDSLHLPKPSKKKIVFYA